MKKFAVRCLLSLFACALVAADAIADEKPMQTFTLTTPRYYMDGSVVWGNPSFISGTRGAFPCFSGSTTSSSYYCSSDSGYYVSGWKLVTAGLYGNTEVASWGSQDSITVTFDYDWASEYGTDLELIVYVEKLGYTLEYDANGGDWTAGQPEGGEHKYSDTVTAASDDCVRMENHELTGWKSKDGSLIKPGEEFDGDSLGIAKNGQAVTLYAQWAAATYKVTLETNGGVVIKNLASYTYGEGATLPLAKKAGSTFEGWYDNPLFVSNVVTQITATDKGDKTFYAKFSTDIHYNGNGATDGTMSDTPFVVDKSVQLAKNEFSRVFTVSYDANGGTVDTASEKVEYAFRNWNSQPDGLGTYTYGDMQDVTNPCGSTGGAVTLYAQWQPESVTVTLPEARDDYDNRTFLGWFTAQKENEGIRVGGAGSTYAPAWNVKLYAHWGEAKRYTVKFSPGADMTDEEAKAMTNRTYASGRSFTLPECEYPTPLAYTNFVGWAWNGKTYKVGDTFTCDVVNDGEEVLFRAVWDTSDLSKAVGLEGVAALTNNTPTGAWVADGKSAKCPKDKLDSMVMVVQGSGTLTFDYEGGEIRHVMFIEGGTTTDLSGSGTHECPITGKGLHSIRWWHMKGTADTYISNVVWTSDNPASYDVSAVVSPSSAGTVTGGGAAKFGDMVTLTATANAGYEFVRWSDGNTDRSHTVKVTCTESYQAIFRPLDTGAKYYYILFDGNGADNMSAMDGQQVAVGVPTALTANNFMRSGYHLKYWSETRYSGGTTYADKAEIALDKGANETMTLYAIWEADASSSSDSDAGTGTSTDSGAFDEPIEPGVYLSRVGVTVTVDLLSAYPNLKSVSGLPTGLKYNKNTGLVTGTPKKAISKTDNVKLTFKDRTTSKITWRVEALPAMMVGTYYGRAYVDGQAGQFQLKLTAAGKATGFFYASGKKVSFKSTGLAYEDADCCVATVSYTYNRTKYTDEIYLMHGATVAGTAGNVDLWFAVVGEGGALESVEAGRDVIKDVFGKVEAETVSIMDKTEDGEYLTAKITAAGAVKVSGKLLSDAGKLVSVSCSTHLLVSENVTEYFYVTIYKTVSKSEPIVVDEIVE